MPRIKVLLGELALFLLASPVLLCLAVRRGLKTAGIFQITPS